MQSASFYGPSRRGEALQQAMRVWLSESLHCFGRKPFLNLINVSTMVLSILARTKTATKPSLRQSVPTATAALLLFQGMFLSEILHAESPLLSQPAFENRESD